MERKRRLRKVDSVQDFQAQEYDSVQYAVSDDIVAYMRLVAAIAVLSDGVTIKLPRPIIFQGSIGSRIWNESDGNWDLDEESEKVSLTELKTLILPDGTVIKDGTTDSLFDNCGNLEYVKLSHDFSKIGDYMFEQCSNLSSVTIPDSVTSIGVSAFADCSGLTSVTIPNSVTSIGDSAFVSCTSLSSVTIGNSVKSIEQYAFSSCRSLSSVTIPDSVSHIGYCAFQGCESLDEIELPDSINIIDRYAFDGTNLTSVIIGSGLTYVGYGIFGEDGSSSIRSVTLRNGLSAIRANMFFNYSVLSSIIIPDSVTSIGDGAFENCYRLTSVTIGNSVTSIGNNAFYYCYRLTSVTIPNSVTNIGNGAFSWCSNLSSIIIGSGVTRVGESAFEGCPSLTTIRIMSTHEIDLRYALSKYYEPYGPYTIYVPSSKVDYYTNHFTGEKWECVTIEPMS